MSHITVRMHLMPEKMALEKIHTLLKRSTYSMHATLFLYFPFWFIICSLFSFKFYIYLSVWITFMIQGCDCLGYIKYFDAHFTNYTGGIETIENCGCLHEEDHGILWKHQDWRTGLAEVRRSRRLTVSFICTVANYEYGFFWHFYQVRASKSSFCFPDILSM